MIQRIKKVTHGPITKYHVEFKYKYWPFWFIDGFIGAIGYQGAVFYTKKAAQKFIDDPEYFEWKYSAEIVS